MDDDAVPLGFRATDALARRTMRERLVDTCALHDAALEIIAARVRRERPGATDEDILEAQKEWLQGGDLGPGRPVPWPR